MKAAKLGWTGAGVGARVELGRSGGRTGARVSQECRSSPKAGFVLEQGRSRVGDGVGVGL